MPCRKAGYHGRLVMDKKGTILYIDDEQDNLDVFYHSFRNEFDILLAKSAKEGIEKLKNSSVEIIIADQRMPHMTGVAFLESIIPLFPGIIRIVMSAYFDHEALLEAVNKGKIYHYVLKPWSGLELRKILRQARQAYQDQQYRNKADLHAQEIAGLKKEIDVCNIQTRQLEEELETYKLRLSQKLIQAKEVNNYLIELKERVGQIAESPPGNIQPRLEKLIRSMDHIIEADLESNNFNEVLGGIHPGFYRKLKEKSAGLSQNDLKLCALLKQNLNSKEIANVLAVSAESINKARYRLRKKLGLTKNQDLVDFLLTFNSQQ